MEKNVKPASGFFALLLALISLASSIYLFIHVKEGSWQLPVAITALLLFIFLIKGLMIVQPNHSRVLIFFGKYAGSVKDNGLFFVNPFYGAHKISLRAENLQGQTLKVNDKMGNPIEIGAVIVWKVGDTYKA